MRRDDLEELSEDLWEPLHLISGTQANVQSFLNATLPQAKHLQENVFFFQPPLIHILLFFISGIMLLVARTGTSRKKSYKAMLVIALTLSAFALALALVTILGSLQGMNALLNSSSSGQQRDLGDSLYMSRDKGMLGLQGGSCWYCRCILCLDGGALCAENRRGRDWLYSPSIPVCRKTIEEEVGKTKLVVGTMLGKEENCGE